MKTLTLAACPAGVPCRWPVIYQEQRLSASVGLPKQILSIPYKRRMELGDLPPTREAHQVCALEMTDTAYGWVRIVLCATQNRGA